MNAARSPAAINYDAYARYVLAVLDDGQTARLPVITRFILSPGALRAMGRAP